MRSGNSPDVVPTAFRLDAFLRVLCPHAPFEDAAHFCATPYNVCSLDKTGWTFKAMIERCGTAKDGVELARAVCSEWDAWSQEAVVEARPEKEKCEKESEAEQKLEGELSERIVSRVWTGLMYVLARK